MSSSQNFSVNSVTFALFYTICLMVVLNVRYEPIYILYLVMIRTNIIMKKKSIQRNLISSEHLISLLHRSVILALLVLYLQSTLIRAFLQAINTLLLIDRTVLFVFTPLLDRHTHHSILSLHYHILKLPLHCQRMEMC